jgi:diguanylate cyclase (GGDEF)-like protein/PAS domain S-box-containing protein
MKNSLPEARSLVLRKQPNSKHPLPAPAVGSAPIAESRVPRGDGLDSAETKTPIDASDGSERAQAGCLSLNSLLEQAFAQAPVGIALINESGIFAHCNASYATTLGYEPRELVGRTVAELTAGADAEATTSGLARLWAGTIGVLDIEKRYIRKDGKPHWVRISTAILRQAGLPASYAVEYLRDISDRKRTEDALRVVRERLALAAESAGIGIWEWDAATNCFFFDDRMYGLFGCLSSGGIDPYSLWESSLHPLDRERLTIELWSAIRGDSRFDSEYRIVLSSGEIRHLKAAAEVMRDPAGHPVRVVGVNIDITKRKTAEEAMLASEHKFRSLFELAPVGIALNDLQTGQFLHLNNALAEPTGFSHDELLGMTYWDITPIGYGDKEAMQIDSLQRFDRYGPYEKEYRRKDGRTYPVLLSGIRVVDGSGRALVWSFVQDISVRKAMELQLTDAARRDTLTGLANRAVFMERLAHAVARVQSGRQALFAVLFLDFDRFKLTNDTLGHAAGDELLKQIAKRLRGELRTSDIHDIDEAANVVSRFGGDEFLILINDLKVPRDALRISERLLRALAPVYSLGAGEVHSTASIGIVTSDQCLGSADDVVRNADVAMYEAKHAGRARAIVFSEAMQTRLSRHVMLENELRRAIGTTQLTLVYQPIVELATGRLVSVEALARWDHPTLGAILPTEFIPIAEESDLIVDIGNWVQAEACRDMVEWRRLDPDGAPRTVSVNVSRAELTMGPRFLEQINSTLQTAGLPAECLQLEITEREVMREPEQARALLTELRILGVQLAMDDFGTGTSSLGCLRHYPFNTVKIDRSFVQDLTNSPDVLAVIHATIQLIENLNMASLAEGVEELAQTAALLSLGCRLGQGYLFSPPVAANVLLSCLKTRG